MPTGLIQAYGRNRNKIWYQSINKQLRALAILRWATFTKRPLPLPETTDALAVMDDDNRDEFPLDDLPDALDPEYVNYQIIESCRGLDEVRKIPARQRVLKNAQRQTGPSNALRRYSLFISRFESISS
jgi:hypothetical protein